MFVTVAPRRGRCGVSGVRNERAGTCGLAGMPAEVVSRLD